MPDLVESVKKIQAFERGDLTSRIASLEKEFDGINKQKLQIICSDNMIDDTLLDAALALKKAAGQVNTVTHAVGVILLLPKILRSREVIESLSLGAGSTGKKYDLETNQRIAEFKFIHWRGRDSLRQDRLFKDFFYLAEDKTDKRRCLYVLEAEIPLKFLNNSTRAIISVFNRDTKSLDYFREKYGTRFSTVSEYYNYRKHLVEIIDINQIMPSLASILP